MTSIKGSVPHPGEGFVLLALSAGVAVSSTFPDVVEPSVIFEESAGVEEEVATRDRKSVV